MQQSVWCVLVLIGQFSVLTHGLYDYHHVNNSMNWTNAQNHCRTHYTDLATVTNNSDMMRLLKVSTFEPELGAWIGLHRRGSPKHIWHWSQPWIEYNYSQTNWGNKDPAVESDGNEENCAFVRKSLTLGDIKCSQAVAFLCYNDTDDPAKRFHVENSSKDWLSAQKYCRKHYTDLVSGDEQIQESKKKICSANDLTIGLFKDNWGWSDGSSFSFRHWKEVNDGCNCALVKHNTMESKGCEQEMPFFCLDDKVELVRENKTWEEALKHCRQHHHDLLSITSLDEQRWIREKAKMADSTRVWLGLRHSCALDLWFWVSNQLVYYHNWGAEVRVENCNISGAMERGGGNKWVSMQDTEKLNFLCLKR